MSFLVYALISVQVEACVSVLWRAQTVELSALLKKECMHVRDSGHIVVIIGLFQTSILVYVVSKST